MRALSLVALAVGVAVASSIAGCTSTEGQCSRFVDEAVEQSSMESFAAYVGQCLGDESAETAAAINSLMGQVSFSFVDAETKEPVAFPANLFWVHGEASEEEIAWRKKYMDGLEIVDQGSGKYLIKNLLPGEYVVLAVVPDYGYKNVAQVEVLPAKLVELGEIEVALEVE